MSNENLMLTLLIPRPKQLGNDINVYLVPLVEDLNKLWVNGVEVYDAMNKLTFNLKRNLDVDDPRFSSLCKHVRMIYKRKVGMSCMSYKHIFRVVTT